MNGEEAGYCDRHAVPHENQSGLAPKRGWARRAPWCQALDVEVVGGLAFVADGLEGLKILRMNLPDRPQITSQTLAGNELVIKWKGRGHTRLEVSTDLSLGEWRAVPASEDKHERRLRIEGQRALFRVAKT